VSERPLGGGRAKIENSSRPHPRKFGQKRFLAVRRSWREKWGGLFWATSLEKIFGGVIAIISFHPGGWMQAQTGSESPTGIESARGTASPLLQYFRYRQLVTTHSAHTKGARRAP